MKMEEEAAEDKAMFESESWCTNPFGDPFGEGAAVVGACACMSPVIFGMVFNWSSIVCG
jgi:hypothetical protein